jgi:hypothetical protein
VAAQDALKNAIVACTADQDMFLYSGGIYEDYVAQAMNTVATAKNKDRVTIVLTTDGGDPHAAYRFGRFLQSLYSYIRVLVVGRCKSAGTLVTMAANELAFGPFGELGPLDVQIAKRDELVFVNSGLDTMQAFMLITGHVYTAFENYMLQTVLKSQGAISFATASEVASRLATGFIAPLAAQIDPHRLGEIDRMMAIATAYGERLSSDNLQEGALERLVNDYPSHSFIIDMAEAKTLFKNVTFMKTEEIILTAAVNQALGGCVYRPSDDIVVYDVRLLGGDPAQEGDDDEEATAAHGEAADNPKPETNAAPPRKRAKGHRPQANGPETAGRLRPGDEESGGASS